MPKKRRILEKIKIDEISGVDRPCQPHALVTIMKRAQELPMNSFAALEDRVLILKDRADVLTRNLTDREPTATSSNDFDALVAAEIKKGCPASVAGQRVVLKHGARPDASRVSKSASAAADFLSEVDALVAKGNSRTTAMSEARRQHPDLFAKYQEA